MAGNLGSQLSRMFGKAVAEGARSAVRELTRSRKAAPSSGPQAPAGRPKAAEPARATGGAYAGDFEGVGRLEYAPFDDDRADPGEVVWAWVPYEENDGRGKDRPVLVIGRNGDLLLALMLTSKDHDRDADDEARHGRHWFDLGSGKWDRSGRPSEVRIDRVLQLEPTAVRREGAALDRRTYDEVADEVRRVLRW